MSKKELLAKRLLLAVTCAVSIQMLSTQIAWAVDSNTGATDSQQSTVSGATAEADKPDSSEATDQDKETEPLAVQPQTNYFSRAANSNDYGIMPLAATPPMSEDSSNANSLAIGTGATASGRAGIAIGETTASGTNSIAIGRGGTTADSNISIAIGTNAQALSSYSIVMGFNATAEANAVVIGPYAKAESMGVAIGSSAYIGPNATESVAISGDSYAIGGVALGSASKVNTGHEYSTAIGSLTSTSAENQVSFGKAVSDNSSGTIVYTGWTNRRSLAGISDINIAGGLTGVNNITSKVLEDTSGAATSLNINGVSIADTAALSGVKSLAFSGTDSGALTGVTGINGVTVEGDNTNGLKLGGSAILGATDTPFSSTGFSVDKVGALTANSVAVGSYGLASDGALTASSLTIGSYGLTNSGALTALSSTVGSVVTSGTTITGVTAIDGISFDTTNGKIDGVDISALDDTVNSTTDGLATKASIDSVTTLGTTVSAMDTAYKQADSDMKAAYELADTALGDRATALETAVNSTTDGLATKASKTELSTVDSKVDAMDTAYKQADSDMKTAYESADTALGSRATALETAATGMSYNPDTTTTNFTGSLSAAGLTTTGTVSANSFTEDGTALSAKYAAIADAYTTSDKNAFSDLKDAVDQINTSGVGTADTAGVERTGDASSGYVTTVESNTAISTTGITTNALSASGTVTASEFVEGSSKLSEKYAAIADAYTIEKAALKADKTDFDTLDDTVNNSSTGLVKQVTDLGSNKADKAAFDDLNTIVTATDTGLVAKTTQLSTTVTDMDAAYKLADTNITTAYKQADSDMKTAYEAADTTLASRATALETAATGMTYSPDTTTTNFAGNIAAAGLTVTGSSTIGNVTIAAGELSGVSKLNGTAIAKDNGNITIDGINLSALKDTVDNINVGPGGVSTNVEGISRDQAKTTTTIEQNTAITTAGIAVTGAISATGTITANEFIENGQTLADTYAGKSAFTTLSEAVNHTTTGLATKASQATVDDLKDNATGITAAAWKTALGVDDLQTATTNMSYANNTTTFTNALVANSFAVGSSSYGFAADGALTALTVNGLAIDANKTTIGTHSLDDMAQEIQDLKDSGTGGGGGVATADTKGIKRSAADSSNPGYYQTIVEGKVAIDTAGVVTGVRELNGIKFTNTSNAITDVESINGITIGASDNTVGGVKLDGGSITLGTSGTLNGIGIAGNNSAPEIGDFNLATMNSTITAKANADASGIDAEQWKTALGVDQLATADNINNLTAKVNTNSTAISSLNDVTQDMSYTSGTTTFAGAVTATGNITAAEFYEGTVKLSDKYTGVTEFGELKTKITEDTTKLFKSAGDLDTRTGVLEGKTTAISYSASTNTTTIGGVTIQDSNIAATVDNIDITTLKATVDQLAAGATPGTINENINGITRSVDPNDAGKSVTTIEGATTLSREGINTTNLVAATGKLGGIDFGANQLGDMSFENGAVKNIGAVNFGANGAMSGIASINGMVFGNGSIGGVSLSGGKVNGVDVTALQSSVTSLGSRVTNIENNGGGSGGGTGGGGGANTGGISRPDPDKGTVIEGNTTVDQDGITTGKVNATDKVIVAEGEDNQVTISKDGIHVGKNSSVMNDTEGFITDKGLYIGVNSSNDISTAKFSIDNNGNLKNTAGGHTFSNTASGAVFESNGQNTTIKGNTITTGKLEADQLIVGGNVVNVAGGTIAPSNAVDVNLQQTSDGKDYTNRFQVTELNGTIQTHKVVDGDTTQELQVKSQYDGMSLSSNKTTVSKDGSGNVTRTETTTGKTTMTGDSISLSKTEVVKDKDGNETSKTTSSTNIDSGEIYLNNDGNSIAVGSTLTGLQSDVRDLDNKVSRMGTEIKEVGALSAALAGLHPMPEDANARTSMAMAIGSYEGKQAVAVGGFYRPNKRTMLSVGGSFTTSKQMFNMGVSFALDRMPTPPPYKGIEMKSEDKETLQMVLARLDEYGKQLNVTNQKLEQVEDSNKQLEQNNKKLEEDNKKLAAEYAALKAKYENN